MNNFLKFYPELKSYIINTEIDNSKWGHLDCQWHEKITNEADPTKNKDLVHLFSPLINKENGDIYLDCSKKKIYAKFILHTLYRPIHIVAKTLFHAAFFISIPYVIISTIINGYKNKKSAKEISINCLKNSAKSFADIVRTPLYGIAIIIVSIAAVIIGPFAPRSLYTLREIVGKLVQELNWNDEDAYERDVFICFQPILNIQSRSKWKSKQDDTQYPAIASVYEIQLINFARAQIHYRRKERSPFCNGCVKVDPNVTYKSPTYGYIERVKKAQQATTTPA